MDEHGNRNDDALTVFFNPKCSKCRGAVETLNERGVVFSLVEYLVAPPKREVLESIVDKLVGPIEKLVRTDDPLFSSLGLTHGDYVTKSSVVDLLLVHPALMQRPVIVRGDEAFIAREPGSVDALLAEN